MRPCRKTSGEMERGAGLILLVLPLFLAFSAVNFSHAADFSIPGEFSGFSAFSCNGTQEVSVAGGLLLTISVRSHCAQESR